MMFALAGGLFSTSAQAQNWSGSTVGDAEGKTVYLWNVGAKKFLGKGGRWGTEAVISNVGTPFTLKMSDSKFYLTSLAKAEGGESNGCLEFMNGVNSTHDAGNFFVDRKLASVSSSTYPTFFYSFTGEQTAYQFKVTSSNGSSSDYIGTFYLVADPATGKAKGEATIATGSEDYSKWIIVTLDKRKEFFKEAEASESSSVPATFLMDDQDFARNDLSVTSWKTKSSSSASTFDGTLSNSSEFKLPSYAYSSTKFYKHTYTGTCTYTYIYFSYSHNVTYTITNTIPGEQQKANNPTLTAACGGVSNRNHNSTNVTVTYSSSEEVENPGYTYYVGNGYGESNTTDTDEDGNSLEETSKEQEIYGGEWTANIHGAYGVVNQTISNKNMIREGWYKVSCVGFTTATTGTAQLYASAGTASEVGDEYNVQPLTNIASDSRPTTYVKASKLINGNGSKYEASVMVYVYSKSDADATLKTLSFGIQVKDADASDWTCFDNFQIEYLGKPTQELVLDEEQQAVDYINKQTSTELNQKKTLYLHRTLNANKWNSIVLPVDLTVGQVQSAFGDNTKLSEFKGATNKDIPGRMYFEEVQVDRDNKNATAIKAGTLYIMKPTKEEPTDQKNVELPTETGISKTLNSYFTIVGVNKSNDAIEASVKGETGDETYSKGKVQFVGTYVAADKLIPANSYVLRGNKDDEAGLWFYRTVATTTKGFRGWLEVKDANAAGKISFSINGVVADGEVTSIDGLELDETHPTRANVYNLSGQLVRKNASNLKGLAKGVYVYGGKKIVID